MTKLVSWRVARGVVQGLVAVCGVVALGVSPSSCQSGGIGDPCTPEDEYKGTFGGFRVTQENIESRSFQCESRICLVNHFQGRVSCPLGQGTPETCAPGGSCSNGGACTESSTFLTDCDKETKCPNSQKCNAAGYCECGSDADCPADHHCDTDNTHQCKLYVCHKKDNCQDPTAKADANKDKDCCLPGTDTPVGAEVCGQCGAEGLRDAVNAVYCSCRCGVAEGQPEDTNFNFCDCPDGFDCAEVRPNLGLGDQQLTGKYCIKHGDPIIKDGKVDPSSAATACGGVVGHLGEACEGQKVVGE